MSLQDRERKIERDTQQRIARYWLALVFIALFWGILAGWSLRIIVVK